MKDIQQKKKFDKKKKVKIYIVNLMLYITGFSRIDTILQLFCSSGFTLVVSPKLHTKKNGKEKKVNQEKVQTQNPR
jgi:hypothetical protein